LLPKEKIDDTALTIAMDVQPIEIIYQASVINFAMNFVKVKHMNADSR
jgi:hypothetical protein